MSVNVREYASTVDHKAAFAAAKRRGMKLGNAAAFTPERQLRGRITARAHEVAKARARAAQLLPIVHEFWGAGIRTASRIALALNARGILSASGRLWTKHAVRQMQC